MACNTLEANVEGHHTLWDGKYPDDSPSPNWASHVKNMRKQGRHAGELEILALSKATNLTVYVVRPGLPTLQIGKGRAAVWVKLERRNYEPIVTSTDVATVANRRQHCKEIHKAYKWTTVVTMKAAGHLTGNEGRGGARSSERGSAPRRLRSSSSTKLSGPVTLCAAASEALQPSKRRRLSEKTTPVASGSCLPSTLKVSKREGTAEAVSIQVFLPSTLGARAATKSVSRSASTENLPRTLAASVARDFLANCSKTETGARKSKLKEKLTREPRQMDVRKRSTHENILARKQRIEGGCASSVDIQQHSKRLRWLSTQRDAAARDTAAKNNLKCMKKRNECRD